MFVETIFSTFFPNLKKLDDGDSKPPTRKVLSFYKISQKVLFLDNLSFGNSLGQNRYGELCGYNLLVRKMKELLLNNIVSNAKESTTFSMNTGQLP